MRRCDHGVPSDGLESGQALGDSRHLGQARHPLGRSDGEELQSAGFDKLQRHAEVVEHAVDAAGDRSLSAGAEPRYGTFCSFTCAIIWNISDVSCDVVPLPCVASVTLPGLACVLAMNSLILLAAILSGLTTRALGTRAITTIGTNWRGSNSRCG